jgi:hypothetical protein
VQLKAKLDPSKSLSSASSRRRVMLPLLPGRVPGTGALPTEKSETADGRTTEVSLEQPGKIVRR